MITLDEARSVLAHEVQALPPRWTTLEGAVGCTLARSLRSEVDVPAGDVAAMDGYAVRHQDVPAGGALRVECELAAGAPPSAITPRTAARIFTGALLPTGADAVVPQEKVTTGGDGLVELPPVKSGQHVRRRGEVVSRGQLLAAAGEVVTPQMVSLLAACGASEVEATPRPTVAVVVTGSELVSPGQSPAAGCIRDSNGPLLSSLVTAAGMARTTQMWADDTQTSIAEALSRALTHADLVLTTGGVSVGSYDLVPAALRELGAQVLFHGVALKPGKPILVARVGGRWLVGLPGNPLAVLVGWRVFAWPLARALAGDPHAFAETPISAHLDERVQAADGRTELRPAVLYRNGTARVHVLPWKGSHDVAAAAPANALARLDPAAAMSVGAAVPCYPLSWPQPGGASW